MIEEHTKVSKISGYDDYISLHFEDKDRKKDFVKAVSKIFCEIRVIAKEVRSIKYLFVKF
jgi:hypothetical protein